MELGNLVVGRAELGAIPQDLWGVNHATWFHCMGLGSAFFLDRLLFGIEIETILGLPLADVLGITFVGLGGLMLIASLGRPLRVLGALRNPRSSWISRGAIADFLFLLLGGLLLLPYLAVGGSRPLRWLPWGSGTLWEGILAWAAAATAAFIIVYPGLVLAVLRPIPFWNTSLIPLQYLTSAFATGAGIAYLLGCPASARAPAQVALVSILSTLVISVTHVARAHAQGGAARLSAAAVTRGQWAAYFLGGGLLLGLLVPGLLLLLHLAGGLGEGFLALAGALLLGGNFLSKYAVIKAGYFAPLIGPLRGSPPPPS